MTPPAISIGEGSLFLLDILWKNKRKGPYVSVRSSQMCMLIFGDEVFVEGRG